MYQQYDGIVAILASVIHITDLKFVHDADTDGVFIENEHLVEMGELIRCSLVG